MVSLKSKDLLLVSLLASKHFVTKSQNSVFLQESTLLVINIHPLQYSVDNISILGRRRRKEQGNQVKKRKKAKTYSDSITCRIFHSHCEGKHLKVCSISSEQNWLRARLSSFQKVIICNIKGQAETHVKCRRKQPKRKE